MIEDDLRSYYAHQSTDPAATGRVLATVLAPLPRRRVAPTAAAGVTVAAVAALAIGVTQLHNGGHAGTPAANGLGSSTLAASESPTSVTTPTAAAGPTAQPSSPDSTPIAVSPPSWVLQMVIKSLPGNSTGGTAKFVGNTTVGGFVYNDGKGAARIDFSVTWPSNAPKAAVPSGCQSDPNPGPDCTTLPDGTQLDLSKGSNKGTAEWDASAYLTSHIQIQIMEWNAPTAKGSAPTRVDPPLSLDELKTLVTNCRWAECQPPQPNPSGVSTTSAG